MAKKRRTSTQRVRSASRTERALKTSTTTSGRGSEPPKRPPGEGKIEEGPVTTVMTP
jgi:hypothetical protein